MNQQSLESITDLLRNSLPGYVLVFILYPMVLDIRRIYGDTIAGAVLLSGPILGLLLFNLYLTIYRSTIWSSQRVRNQLGFKHITKLIQYFPSNSRDEIRAVWDYVLFQFDGPIVQRVLFLYSRAHSWGGITLGLAIGSAYWYCVMHSLVWAISLVVSAIIVAFVPYRFAVRQGATLESILLELNWKHVESETSTLGWSIAKEPI